MNKFKEMTIKSYGWELCWSHEVGKKRIQSKTKKDLRRLSRTRLKRELNKDILKARVD